MAGLIKINPEGKDYLVPSGGGGRNNSGPSGRRLRSYRLMRKVLAGNMAGQTLVISCNDQHGNLGTGVVPPLPPKPKPHLIRQQMGA